MLFWVVVARWSYAEIAQFSPALRESVDHIMEVATIPTHDQWDLNQIKEIGNKLASAVKIDQAFAGENQK